VSKSSVSKKNSVTVPSVSPNPNALSFSLKEAAAITGVRLWAIRTAVWSRKLPAHLVGKKQIVLRADLEKWIAATPLAHRGRRAA